MIPESAAPSWLEIPTTRLAAPLASMTPGCEKPSNQPVRSTAYGRAKASSGVAVPSAVGGRGNAPGRFAPLASIVPTVALASGTPSRADR